MDHAGKPDDVGLLRELSMALGNWGDTNTEAGRDGEALAAYHESLDIFSQLHQTLGDTPQVLRDLSVSLINVGGAEDAAGHGSQALAAYRESLDIRRQLRQTLGDTPQLLDDLAVSLERLAGTDTLALDDRQAALQEALHLRERLVSATDQSAYHVGRLKNAKRQAESLGLTFTETGEAEAGAPAARTSG